MGQNEGKLAAGSHPQHNTKPPTHPQNTTSNGVPNNDNADDIEGEETEDENEERENKEGEKNNNVSSPTPPTVSRLKTNKEVLKKSTEELVGGINKLGANLLSTAKGANLKGVTNKVTNYSAAGVRKAANAVEDAIVTVKAGIYKTEEEPELTALASMPLFFPIIRSSVPITDLAKGLPIQKTTIEYLDPRYVLSSLLDFQRLMTLTSKMIAARQAELSTKIKDTEMSSGRKTVFTLAMNVTDLRHFNTQFSEIPRFHSNLERTKQSIKDILVMLDKLNSILPPDEQLEKLNIPERLSSAPSSASSSSSSFSNFASLSPPSSHSSFPNLSSILSSSSGNSSHSSHSSFSNLAALPHSHVIT